MSVRRKLVLLVLFGLVLPGCPPLTGGALAPPAGARSAAESPLAQARRTGQPVEITSLRSETTSVFAEPSGGFSQDLHTAPMRVRQGSRWVPVDTRLARRPDGTISPVAVPATLVLSGGEDGPLLTYSQGGASLSLTWPGRLPRPVLSGQTATYPGVLSDVDLRVTATSTGFSELFVVKTRQAAQAVRQIRFGLVTQGATLAVSAQGTLVATDARGEVVLSSAIPYVWDSGPRGDKAPSPGGRYGQVGLRVDGDGLTLTPDARVLADPVSRFPLYIDPTVAPPLLRQHWTMVEKDLPNYAGWFDHATYRAQVGRDPAEGTTDRFRSYFLFPTSRVAGKHILTATLHLFETWAYSCTAERLYAFRTEPVTGTTSWSNAPAKIGTELSHVDISRGGGTGSGCQQAGGVDMDVTSLVASAAAAAWTDVTIGLFSDESSGSNGAKEFLTDPYLHVIYNTVPGTPRPVATSTMTGCSAAGTWASTTTPELAAILDDADRDQDQKVAGRFEVQTSAGNQVWTAPLTAYNSPGGAPASVQVPPGLLADGGVYRWRVSTWDTVEFGPASAWCAFTVDVSAPDAAPLVWSDAAPDGCFCGARVDQPLTFTLSSGVPDVTRFRYNLNGAGQMEAAASTGTAVTVVVPVTDGPNFLTVSSVDAAGNAGPEYVYFFGVDALSGPVAQWPLEHDLSGDVPLSATGNIGFGDGAMHLEGANTFASAPSAVVSTASTFSVTAWVRLDQPDGTYTAVAQDGASDPAFRLGMDGYYHRWGFAVAGDLALSHVVPQAGVWTHLAGVFDAQSAQLSIYVNGRLSGTATRTSSSSVDGRLQLGRGQWLGMWAHQFPGDIRDVRVFDRVVSAREVNGFIGGPPWGSQARWAIDEGGAERVSTDTTGNGHALFLNPAVSWTSHGAGAALHFDSATQAMAFTEQPVVRPDRDFSVAGWVRVKDMNDSYGAISQDGGIQSGFALRLDKDSQAWVFEVASAPDVPNTAVTAAKASTRAQAGVWTHLAGVYDSGAHQLRLYVNGRPAAAAAFDGASFVDKGAGSLVLGRRKNIYGYFAYFWSGDIDQVQVADTAWDEAGVRLAMGGGSFGGDAMWHLDEGVGLISTDGTANAFTVTATGVGTSWVDGKRGKALQLEPAASGLAFSALPVVRTDASFTAAAWVRLDRTDNWFTAVSQDGGFNSGFGLGYEFGANLWKFSMPGETAAQQPGVTRSLQAAQKGIWTHLTGVYDAAAGQMRLYVNGRLAGAASYNSTWNATGSVQIGRARAGGSWAGYWPGAVDEVQLASRVLSDAEITALAGPETFGPSASWSLDEGTGLVGADATGSGHNLALTGNTTWVTRGSGKALHFDGATGSQAYSDTAVVRTDASFTVAAWVRLSADDTWFSALSQDGDNYSGFDLRYDAPNRRWAFVIYGSDSPRTRPVEYAVGTCAWCYEVGTWTHLAGVYDAGTHRMSLYVNGQSRGSTPVTVGWNARGAIQIGRSKYAGLPVNFWPGDIDKVVVQSGVLNAGQIAALM